MRDAGLVEHAAYRPKSRLQIEAFGVQLRVQDCATVTECARPLEHEIQQAAADAVQAPFALDRHPADFHVLAIRQHPGASYAALARQSHDMEGTHVIGVELDRLGDALLLDKDAPTDSIGGLP